MSDPTLAEFLLARYTEDEGVVRAFLTTPGIYGRDAGGIGPSQEAADAFDFGVASDERLLAECEMKRALVELAEADERWGDGRTGHAMLRILAQPYADHPDYREEWRP